MRGITSGTLVVSTRYNVHNIRSNTTLPFSLPRSALPVILVLLRLSACAYGAPAFDCPLDETGMLRFGSHATLRQSVVLCGGLLSFQGCRFCSACPLTGLQQATKVVDMSARKPNECFFFCTTTTVSIIITA